MVMVASQQVISVGKANEKIVNIKRSGLQIFDDEESILSIVINVQENITSLLSNAINAHVVDKSIAEVISVEDDIVTSTTNSFSTL